MEHTLRWGQRTGLTQMGHPAAKGLAFLLCLPQLLLCVALRILCTPQPL